jgi:hypothetical protein
MEDVRSDLNALEQLVNLLVRHLLTELGEDISQLSSANVAISFLIKDLEPTDELLCDRETRTDQTRPFSMTGRRMRCTYLGCRRA